MERWDYDIVHMAPVQANEGTVLLTIGFEVSNLLKSIWVTRQPSHKHTYNANRARG
jgi:hypothetical protein